MTQRTRIILAGAIGNVVEWYDFGLYGLLAPVLASLFFPSHDRIAALLGVYGGFAVGFAMRPIGAIVLGRVGDRRGPRFVLVLSVVLMGAATVAIALLPSYSTVGIWAPILLIVVRLVQGFSVGGEFVGSVTYLVETAPGHRRGISGSVANIGATMGMLLGAGVAALTQGYAHVHLWRIPFLLGGVLAFVAYLLRRHLPAEESEGAQELAPRALRTQQESAQITARWPVLQAFQQIPRTMVLLTLFTCGYGVSNYLIMVFLPTFAREFAGVSEGTALRINFAGQAIAFFVVPLAGWISDRWLRRRSIIGAAFLFQATLAWLLFAVVARTGTQGLRLAQLLLAGFLAFVMGTAPAMLAEQFPRAYRVSGHAFVLNIGIGIAGGTAPMIAVALIHATGSRMAPAAYLILACLVSGITALLLHDRSRESLNVVEKEKERQAA